MPLPLFVSRAVLSFAACAAISSAGAQVQFYGLGYGSGAAFGVSPDGVVVGHTPGWGAAFRRAPDGSTVYYPAPEGGVAGAFGISSDSNVTVGYVGDEAMRWTQTGGGTTLGHLPGFTSAQARAASFDGRVIAGTDTHRDSGVLTLRAFRWTETGGMVSLGTLPGFANSYAWAISGDGSTVVGESHVKDYSQQLAFRWTEADGMVSLGTLPGTDTSQAFGISANGTFIVGASGRSNAREAFLWNQQDGMVALDTRSEYELASAYGVSDDGQLVIGSGTAYFTYGTAPFIWTPNSGMRPLQEVLSDDFGLAAQLNGWSLTYAWGLSPDGRYVVGSGTYDGSEAAWLLDLGEERPVISPPSLSAVPESSTYGLLAALGLAGVLVVRRVMLRSSHGGSTAT